MRYHRAVAASIAAAALITPLLAAGLPASAARQAPGAAVRAGHKHGRSPTQTPVLPAPPRPMGQAAGPGWRRPGRSARGGC